MSKSCLHIYTRLPDRTRLFERLKEKERGALGGFIFRRGRWTEGIKQGQVKGVAEAVL